VSSSAWPATTPAGYISVRFGWDSIIDQIKPNFDTARLKYHDSRLKRQARWLRLLCINRSQGVEDAQGYVLQGSLARTRIQTSLRALCANWVCPTGGRPVKDCIARCILPF
jgi:hypothetical protein